MFEKNPIDAILIMFVLRGVTFYPPTERSTEHNVATILIAAIF
jgi:uncharacterized protein YheU (UPF0270 family)